MMMMMMMRRTMMMVMMMMMMMMFQHEDDYSILFEDTSYADGYSPPLMVAQRYVIACKEDKKK
jgi:hypothetical protein